MVLPTHAAQCRCHRDALRQVRLHLPPRERLHPHSGALCAQLAGRARVDHRLHQVLPALRLIQLDSQLLSGSGCLLVSLCFMPVSWSFLRTATDLELTILACAAARARFR
eukprot:15160203-Alexandrium_andersonii.AAC.1